MFKVLAVLLAFASTVPGPDPSPGPSPTAADIPALITQLKAGYDTTSWKAVDALGSLGRPAVQALLAVAQDRTLPDLPSVRNPARYQAVQALGRARDAAAEAVPVLLVLLLDKREDEGVRWAAASALGSIGAQPDDVVPALTLVIEEQATAHSSLGWYAVGALAGLVRDHPEALPALRKVAPAVKRAHRVYGPSSAFASLLRALEPPSWEQEADEDLIQELLIRDRVEHEKLKWCLHGFRDGVVARLRHLPITDDDEECTTSTPDPAEPTSPTENGATMSSILGFEHRMLLFGHIDWIDKADVGASTSSCYGYDPCSEAEYLLRKQDGRWRIVSVEHPPVM